MARQREEKCIKKYWFIRMVWYKEAKKSKCEKKMKNLKNKNISISVRCYVCDCLHTIKDMLCITRVPSGIDRVEVGGDGTVLYICNQCINRLSLLTRNTKTPHFPLDGDNEDIWLFNIVPVTTSDKEQLPLDKLSQTNYPIHNQSEYDEVSKVYAEHFNRRKKYE